MLDVLAGGSARSASPAYMLCSSCSTSGARTCMYVLVVDCSGIVFLFLVRTERSCWCSILVVVLAVAVAVVFVIVQVF